MSLVRVDCHLHGRVRRRRDDPGGAGRAGRAGRSGRGVRHRPQRDLGRRNGGGPEPGRPDHRRRGNQDARRRHHRSFPHRTGAVRAARGRGRGPDTVPGRPGLRPAPVRRGPVQPGPGAAGAVRGRRGGHRRGLQRQDRDPGTERAGSRLRDGPRPPGRGRLGRARPARHRRGLPGDARLRRPGQLPGRTRGRADNRGVPPACPPLPAPDKRAAGLTVRPITGRSGLPAAPGGRRRRRGTARWPWPA